MKFIILIIFVTFIESSLAQNINGTYNFKPKSNSKSKPFIIEIINDSIYALKSDDKIDDNGKVKKKGNFYYLMSCCLVKDDALNSYNGFPVKITGRKMKVYGINPKNMKLRKVFELTKAGI